ncbi:MAG TPA: tetratricopeptide repeat protein [Polyangiales bacterium]|nr:tetratricopeptide repeat protein [Polyangiales bacterium]
MELSDRDREVHRPLVTRAGLLGLGAGVVVVLSLLLPAAVRRQTQALELLPDALSLVYMDLNLTRRPTDPELRLRVVQKRLQAGQFEHARELLAPLLAASSPVAPRAREIMLQIDHRAWAAIEPARAKERALALARVLADIDALDLTQASPEAVQQKAELCWSLEQPARAASLLDQLARRRLPDYASHIHAAEVAYQRADQTAKAVELQVFFAESDGSREHALRALELAPAAFDARQVLALAERLRARIGADDPQLLAASMQLAEGADVKLAFDLGRHLLRKSPTDAALHRRVARLAEWNGDGLRALDEYVWLTRHGGRPEDRARAIELARANWDLGLLRELLAAPRKPQRRGKPLALQLEHRRLHGTTCAPRRPSSPAERAQLRRRQQLQETLALDEALGDTRAAQAALEAAVSGPLADDPLVWQLRVDLLRRTGQNEAAAEALSELAARFPSEARALALADLLLTLGRTRGALQALDAAPQPHTEAFLRRWYDVAWELGELSRTREIAQLILKTPGAGAWDVARLWQLQRNDPDPQLPLATALAGYERFKNAEMLRLVIASSERLQDDARVASLLEQAEAFGGFRSDPGYWRQRITLHQRLAFSARESKSYLAAKQQLGAAEKALQRAPQQAPDAGDVYQQLWTSQHAQAIALALEADDRAALSEVFAAYGEQLPVRQQVYVLQRLDREAEARELARRAAADPSLPYSDRAALAAEFPEQPAGQPATLGSPDYARAWAEYFDSDGLATVSSQARVALDNEDFGMQLSAALARLTPQRGLRGLQPEAVRDISAELGGRVFGTELDAGIKIRDEDAVRPYGRWRQQLLSPALSASLDLNTPSLESAQLRLLGATDELAVQSEVGLGGDYYVTARAAGNRYLSLNRDYLGAGLSVDAGVGRSFQLPDDFGRAAVRLAGRWAPRFRDPDRAAREDERQPASWIPDSSGFAGVGASLARGELDVPRASDPALRFLLDGSVGVLLPNGRFGFSGQAGIGSALFGHDQLSAQLIAGNVVGAQPYFSVSAGYALGLD